jgi:glutamyl-tRNA reductase
MAHRLVNELLHEPTVRLKGYAAAGSGEDYADALRDLFGLDDDSAAHELSESQAHVC